MATTNRVKIKPISRKDRRYRVVLNGKTIGTVHYDIVRGWTSVDQFGNRRSSCVTKKQAAKIVTSCHERYGALGDGAMMEVRAMLGAELHP